MLVKGATSRHTFHCYTQAERFGTGTSTDALENPVWRHRTYKGAERKCGVYWIICLKQTTKNKTITWTLIENNSMTTVANILCRYICEEASWWIRYWLSLGVKYIFHCFLRPLWAWEAWEAISRDNLTIQMRQSIRSTLMSASIGELWLP